MPVRLSVYRVHVAFGGRKMPREYTFLATSLRRAMDAGLRRARADELDRPHAVEAAYLVTRLDEVPRVARRMRRAG